MIPCPDTDSTRNCSSEQLISTGHLRLYRMRCVHRSSAYDTSNKIKEHRPHRNLPTLMTYLRSRRMLKSDNNSRGLTFTEGGKREKKTPRPASDGENADRDNCPTAARERTRITLESVMPETVCGFAENLVAAPRNKLTVISDPSVKLPPRIPLPVDNPMESSWSPENGRARIVLPSSVP